MSELYYVTEENTGCLQLKDSKGVISEYVPNYNLDEARSLLLAFQQLMSPNGVEITKCYKVGGINWFPPMVSQLYWGVFFQYVKYEPLIKQWLEGNAEFQFEGNGAFCSLCEFLSSDKAVNVTWKQKLLSVLIRINNRIVSRKKVQLLFFRFALHDFRSLEIRKELTRLGVKMVEVVPAPKISDVLRNILKRGNQYFFGGCFGRDRYAVQYCYNGLEACHQRLFRCAVIYVENTITNLIREYEEHNRVLKKASFSVFYGLDDVNSYIYPILLACKKRGIYTIAHQHGAYVKRHAGYVMEGIDSRDFNWFDKLIVWGDYWKEKLIRQSHVHAKRNIVTGANKLSWNYDCISKKARIPKTVLIPYEFLSNTHRIGLYMQKLVDCGFRIIFKPRVDEPIEDQLHSYHLSPECLSKVRVVEKLTPEVIDEIDIIAGTMTTLIYELMPYQKIIWYLVTEYRHLEDLVEEGLAHKIELSDINIREKMSSALFEPTRIERNRLFLDEKLTDTLRRHIMTELQ